MNFQDVRKEVYGYHEKYYAYIFKWPWYSYRRYKALFYIETAGILIFVLLKTNISPNMLTMTYIALSLFTGLLLALPGKFYPLLAALVMFSKPIIDWADGALARIKNSASITGDILDNYGSTLSWIVLWAGLGIYLGNSTNSIFYYLAPLLPAIYAGDIYASGRERFIRHYFINKDMRKSKSASSNAGIGKSGSEPRIRAVKAFIDVIFEHNARTVDIIALLLLIEFLYPVKVLWLAYAAFLIWQVLTFLIKLYMVLAKGWAEDELSRIRKGLYE